MTKSRAHTGSSTEGEAEAMRVWVTWVGKALGRAWLLEWESPKTSEGVKKEGGVLKDKSRSKETS